MTIPSITKNETLGLEAVTTFNEKPYFFLFSDIDSKDPDELLKVLKFYEKWQYSVYYYETTKGFHIVSPVLLSFRTWLFRIESLKKKVPEYRFGAIRISKRPTDSGIAYFQNWNNFKKKESITLHNLMNEIFFINGSMKITRGKKTKLNYIWYNQLNYQKVKTVDKSKKFSGFCMSPINLGSSGKPLGKTYKLFDYDLYNKWRARMDDPVTYDECIEAQL
jgi:hypothetical protein